MSGGGSSQPTSSTVTQTSIPKEFYPYLENIMGSASAQTSQPYTPYPGAKIGDFSTDTKQAFDMNRDNVGSWMPGMQTGTAAVGAAMNQTQKTMGSVPDSSGLTHYQAPGVADVSTGAWNNQAAQNYMSPYISNVLDSQMQQAQRAYGQDRAGIAQSAEAAGAYGGSRQAVSNQMASMNQNQQLQALQANTLNTGYANAQSQFNNDQGRGLQAGMANQSTALSTNGMNLNANLQTQDLGARMDMQKAQTQLQASNQLAQQGGQMAGLGQAYSASNAADASTLAGQGNAQEQLNQASLNSGYQDFIDQRDYPKNNLAWEAGLLQGLPLGSNQTSTTNTQTNPFSQIVGAGLGAAGLYSNLRR